MRDLTTYENMEAVCASVDVPTRHMIVSYWRHRVYGTATQSHRMRVINSLPPLARQIFSVTMPTVGVLNRWERDHGYVSR